MSNESIKLKVLAQFNSDFINVQSGISSLLKDKKGYGYLYADLSQTIGAIQDSINRNGNKIGYIQEVRKEEDGYILVTIIMHVTGYQKEFFYPVIMMESKGLNPVQCLGSSVTYSKRYALQAIFGIATEDDDAIGLGSGDNIKNKAVAIKPSRQKPITDEEFYNDISEMQDCKTLDKLKTVFANKKKKYSSYPEWMDKLVMSKDELKEQITAN